MWQHAFGGQHFDTRRTQRIGYADFALFEVSWMDVAHIRVMAVLLLIALYGTLDLFGDGAAGAVVEPQQTFLDHITPPLVRSKRSTCQVLRLTS